MADYARIKSKYTAAKSAKSLTATEDPRYMHLKRDALPGGRIASYTSLKAALSACTKNEKCTHVVKDGSSYIARTFTSGGRTSDGESWVYSERMPNPDNIYGHFEVDGGLKGVNIFAKEIPHDWTADAKARKAYCAYQCHQINIDQGARCQAIDVGEHTCVFRDMVLNSYTRDPERIYILLANPERNRDVYPERPSQGTTTLVPNQLVSALYEDHEKACFPEEGEKDDDACEEAKNACDGDVAPWECVQRIGLYSLVGQTVSPEIEQHFNENGFDEILDASDLPTTSTLFKALQGLDYLNVLYGGKQRLKSTPSAERFPLPDHFRKRREAELQKKVRWPVFAIAAGCLICGLCCLLMYFRSKK